MLMKINVQDMLGRPVEDAIVKIISKNMHGMTNSKGLISFSVPYGTYTIHVAASGYIISKYTLIFRTSSKLHIIKIGGI